MNTILPRLVLAGLGTLAVAVLFVSLGGSVAGPDAAGYALTDDCCSKQGACAPCPPPPSRG